MLAPLGTGAAKGDGVGDETGAKTFEVHWDEPWEEQVPWRHERWHTPHVISPLGADVTERLIYGGFRQGFANDGQPFRATVKRINGYAYLGFRAPFDDEHEVTETLPPKEQRIDHWERVWLPELQAILDRAASFDAEEATDEELLDHFEALSNDVIRAWTIHGALEFFQDELVAFCREHLNYDEAAAVRLVQGLPNKSLEADAALRSVATIAAATPEVMDALDQPDPLSALRATPEAKPFLEALHAYLAAWGRRSDNFMELAFPSWTEDPAPVLSLVRMYVRAPRDIEADRRRLDAEREAAVAAARERIPADQRDAFEAALELGQRGAVLNEDHNFWIDQQTLHWVRQALIEMGRRLSDHGLIAAPDDVAMLHLDEVLAAMRSPDTDLHTLVTERRAELEAFAALDPPPALGPPFDVNDLESLFGFGDEHRESNLEAQTTIRGQAASTGTHRGIARILRTIAEGDRIQPGDILVTATTSPPWTPLFGAAGAVVTDAGGSLSHAAIVAREYGIPAVVGTANATTLIPDGATIEVDGTAGEVRVIAPPPETNA